jgi:hypothetical protein
MSLKGHELSTRYRYELRRSKPLPEEDCPSPEALMKLARGRVRSAQREGFVRHLGRCPQCAAEYSAMFKIVKEEKRFIKEAARIQRDAVPADGRRSTRRLPHPALSWRSALAALLVLCFAAAAGTLLITRSLQPPGGLRTGAANKLKAVAPVHETRAPDDIVFKWKKVAESDYYIVELFDGEMSLIWRSPRIESSNLALPAETVEAIREEGSYFWMVSAYFSSGDKLESELNVFEVRK